MLDPTEDDTYERLRRISFDEVSAVTGELWYGYIYRRVKHNEWVDQENKKIARKANTVWFLRVMANSEYEPLYRGHEDVWKDIDLSRFEGTGWTPESYLLEVKNRLELEKESEKMRKREDIKKLVLTCLIVCNIAQWISALFGPFSWPINLLLPVVTGVIGGITYASLKENGHI